MSNITVFTKNGCPQCRMTKNYLKTHNIPFTEHNINDEPEYISYLKGQGFQAVPVLEAPGIEPIAGFRPEALKQLAV
ncbi:glutaredoxin-like protein NrdH [Lacticaseibacillus parakribbianus]|uniref:glutaredoxin-like protein NrdH n=1 Tax=Lacticaseibacillus parakribbianus TaxID=2970927 RepID=UPI0021CB0960|nr:glutaredoxin-like protein NrdH [Lacticaseibacillus parakribbianus]